MKTNILRIVFAVIGIGLISCVLANSIHAQTIISFDSSDENALIMKIQDPSLTKRPEKLILVFDDTASITYDFSFGDNFAMLTQAKSGANASTNFYVSSEEEGRSVEHSSAEMRRMLNAALYDVADEEPVELETWMMDPKEWLN